MAITALTPGTRVGPYEVMSLVGVGGMGEVYRARDPRLDRDVALKVLPAAFAHDAERAARFTREAQVIAALDHPHIARLYGIEDVALDAAGQAAGERGVPVGMRALVLEFVDGETLDARLRRLGRVPMEEALELAQQLAEALEAAHARGIVHRDLKPANLKVTPAGVLKVLDFGLAKELAPLAQTPGVGLQAPGDAEAEAATVTTPALTTHGVILGTAAYMAPEQARGKAVDARADIWAFGCVLFELLTGTRAFGGPTVTDVLAAVMRAEPDYAQLPTNVPPAVRLLLQRCLRKDARQRLQAIGDARVELEEARQPTLAGVAGAASSPTAPGHAGTPPARSRGLLAAALLGWIAVAAALAVITSNTRSVRPESQASMPRVTLSLPVPPGIVATGSSSFSIRPLLSPDSRWLALVSGATNERSRIVLLSVEGGETRTLDDTEGARVAFWSPDSRSLGFVTASGQMRAIRMDDGSVRTITDLNGMTAGPLSTAAWGPDGTILFRVVPGAGLSRVSAEGGTVSPATTLREGEGTHSRPFFLADGRFLYSTTGSSVEDSGMRLASLDNPADWRALSGQVNAHYVAPDLLLWVERGSAFAQRFDTYSGSLLGDAHRVVEHVSGPNLTISATEHVLVHLPRQIVGPRSFKWFDRRGAVLRSIQAPPGAQSLELSPDGARIAFETYEAEFGTRDVWVMDVSSGQPTRLTFESEDDADPLWLGVDGTTVIYSTGQTQAIRRVYQRRLDNSGAALTLNLGTPQGGGTHAVSPDGRHLVFTVAGSTWVVPVQGGSPARELLPGVPVPQFAPDGRFISYESFETGRREVFVQPFPATGARWQVSNGGGFRARWHPNGRELVYVRDDGMLMSAPVTLGTSFSSGRAVPLFNPNVAPNAPTSSRFNYAIAKNGSIIAVVAGEGEDIDRLQVVVNWQSALQN